jgi:hypothetical protein
MKKILIIRCGYSAAVSAWQLSAFRKRIEVTVIDRGKNFNYCGARAFNLMANASIYKGMRLAEPI